MHHTKRLVETLAVAVFALCLVALTFVPGTQAGAKHITISVVNSEGAEVSYELNTDAEYLRQAMEETKGFTFSGEETDLGLMILEVNGEVADYSVDQSYWSIYVNGGYGDYGVDSQPITDGDSISFVYTK